MTTPSGILTTAVTTTRTRTRVWNNMQNSGHLRLCQQPRAAHALRSDQLWKTTLVAETKNTENDILCMVILSAYLVVVDILIISHKIFCEEIFDSNTTGNVANHAFGKMSISDPQVLFIFFGWIVHKGWIKENLSKFNSVFAISQLIQHRNLKILVPSPHNTLVIIWCCMSLEIVKTKFTLVMFLFLHTLISTQKDVSVQNSSFVPQVSLSTSIVW